MVCVKFEFSLFGINTYVLYDPATREAAIIDPGMFNNEEIEAIKNFIKRENLKVTHIINTHMHVDHAVGNEYIHKFFGAPVYAHKEEEFFGRTLQMQAQMFGIQEPVMNTDIDHYLADGDIIKIGEGELEVIHVPGHSPGSIALYDKADGFLIAGDALFAGSIGRTDLPGGNMKTLLSSIRNRLFTLPEDTVVYSGHGPETTIGCEARTNPFLK